MGNVQQGEISPTPGNNAFFIIGSCHERRGTRNSGFVMVETADYDTESHLVEVRFQLGILIQHSLDLVVDLLFRRFQW
jgi:hypothetical protein